ncbi:MAG TPA: glycerol-3-phosphate dehydrogenase, partial [Chromatiales bacterium]|nr:glycerol-3-phosphate dehydrogenase [Chromatiales bacterium]
MDTNRRSAETIAVLGAGSWGTALAVSLARDGGPTRLWGRDAARMEALRGTRRNERYLPDAELPLQVAVTADLGAAVHGAGLILLAVPSHAFRATLQALSAVLATPAPVTWATKGLEPATGLLLHEVAAQVFGAGTATAVVSGPTFAREIADGLPAALTVAA